MEDNVFHVVVDATNAKEVWECLRREFGVRGSNTNVLLDVDTQNIDVTVINSAENGDEVNEHPTEEE